MAPSSSLRLVWALVAISLLLAVGAEKHQKSPKNNGIDRRKAAAIAAAAASSPPAYADDIVDTDNETSDSDSEDYASGTVPAPTTSTCGSCRVREDLKQRNLEAIKGEVLRRMGFSAAPNVTGRVLPQVPAHVLAKVQVHQDPSSGGRHRHRGGAYSDYGGYYGDDAGMMGDAPATPPGQGEFETGPRVFVEDDEYHIKTETVVTFAQQYPRLRHNWKGHDVLHFAFSDSLTKYHVSNASLYVYVHGAEKGRSPASFHLEVHKVTSPPKGGSSDTPKTVVVAARKVTQVPYTAGAHAGQGQGGEWVHVDVTQMVHEWFRASAMTAVGVGAENWGFLVTGSVAGKRVVEVDIQTHPGKTPFVEIETQEAKRRQRRSVGLNCDEKTGQPLCCRYPLTVDFEAFGWDFIIAPKRYEAYYCAGDCPVFTLQRYPHTHIMQMAVPNSAAPCCAPRKLSAISMLYFDPQLNVVYGSLPNMVVDRCGCS